MTRATLVATLFVVMVAGWCPGQEPPPNDTIGLRVPTGPLPSQEELDFLFQKSTLSESEFLALPAEEIAKVEEVYVKFRTLLRYRGELFSVNYLPDPQYVPGLLLYGIPSEESLRGIRKQFLVHKRDNKKPPHPDDDVDRQVDHAKLVGYLLQINQIESARARRGLSEDQGRPAVKTTALNEKGEPVVGVTVVIKRRKKDGTEKTVVAKTDEQGEVEIKTDDDETVTEVTVTGKDTKEKKVVNPQPDADGNLKVATDERGVPIAFIYAQRTETAGLFSKKIADELAKLVNADPKDLTYDSEKIENKPITVDGKETYVTIFELTWYVNGKRIPNHIVRQALEELNKNDPDLGIIGPKPRKPAATIPDDTHFSKSGSWQQTYGDQWGMHRVGFTAHNEDKPSAWQLNRSEDRGPLTPCTVAVIGTGADLLHHDLFLRAWMNPNELPNDKDDDGNGFVDDLFGWNFRDNNNRVDDHCGHDTHVAGVIAATTNNDYGIAGINPAAQIMVLKVCGFHGDADSVNISRAIFYAVDHGAKVINISYSGDDPSKLEQYAVDYAVKKGVLVVVAAGNEATNADSRGVATLRGVLTVAATDPEDKRAGFSNFGQAVDISAPGLDILSLRAAGTDFLKHIGEDEEYVGESAVIGAERDLYRVGGTSFAAPFVAGTASLLWSSNPELTLEQVRNKLLMSGRDIDVRGWDQNTGVGLLDARKAISADPDHFLFTRISKVLPVQSGDDISIEVHGQAEGNEFSARWLQIGFGENPAKDEWKTIDSSREPVKDGLLGTISLDSLDVEGTWTIRLIVQDRKRVVRQALARLNVQ